VVHKSKWHVHWVPTFGNYKLHLKNVITYCTTPWHIETNIHPHMWDIHIVQTSWHLHLKIIL
jgi:hypothetical protein